jgi:hypothetical protein
MQNIRFISPNELHHVKTMFSISKNLVGEEITDEILDEMLKSWKIQMERGTMLVNMMFDEDGSPTVMYTGSLFPFSRSWWVGYTKIKKPTNHFNKSAKIMAPVLDHMFEHLERKGYFTVLMGAPEKHHNIRNKVMTKYSKYLGRYNWYDDFVIPRGERSEVEKAFNNNNRRTCYWSDIVVRMFTLKQEYRVEYLRNKNLQDYTGTVPN